MTDAQHAELVELERAGKVLIGVDRTAARRLFTDVSIFRISEATGYSPYLEKSVVLSVFVLGPLAAIGSVVIAFIDFGWWGIIALIACPILYFGYQGLSARGDARPYAISVFLALAIGFSAFDVFSISHLIRAGTVFMFSLWCARMVYVSSTSFFRGMALRSAKLFDFLAEGIQIRRVD